MKYMLLIYGNGAAEAAKTQADQQREMGEYFAYNAAAREAGVMVQGEALYPVTTATTVRSRDGKVLSTDGPFAETVDVLGGFYILDCKDLDEAIAWAGRIPGAHHGSVEIRPIVDFSQMS